MLTSSNLPTVELLLPGSISRSSQANSFIVTRPVGPPFRRLKAIIFRARIKIPSFEDLPSIQVLDEPFDVVVCLIGWMLVGHMLLIDNLLAVNAELHS